MSIKIGANSLVKQSHKLNMASFKLSSLAMDIIYVMISQLTKEDKDFKIYEVSIRDLENKLGKRVDPRYLKKAVKDVMSNPIGIKSPDGSFCYIAWVSLFKFDAGTRNISFRFDSELKPLLLEVKKNFVLSQLKEISSLQSEYAKRIYNILKQWENHSTFKIKVYNLQDMLQVPKSLLTYSNFKLKVLKVAMDQINKNTSLNVSYKEEKVGRKVDGLVFVIKKKEVEIKDESTKGVGALEEWLNEDTTTNDIIDTEVL